ncbi:MAG: DegT/DnrJ/EryC1/StrS family aminotransferase [Planctomycetota bacterium]
MKNPYSIVEDFESAVADYAGSRYAIAVDTCTAALFLCCKYCQVERDVTTLPSRTYCSVPNAIIHAGGQVRFQDHDWHGEYELQPWKIVDSALRFRRGMYLPGTFRCLSFQYRKHLPIGRGGMILTDDAQAADWFRLARFNGRRPVPLTHDAPVMVGWLLYMEPERAARGLALMMNVRDAYPDLCNDYPPLHEMEVYRPYAIEPLERRSLPIEVAQVHQPLPASRQ